jgi:large subunit ribosomal protein L7Ae
MSAEFEVPKELTGKQLDVLEKVSKTGKLKAGVNEVTKAVEREKAKIVYLAQDVDPKEIIMHLPLLCREKKIAFTFVENKKQLGEKAGLRVPTSAVAVMDEGKDKKEVDELAKKLVSLQAAVGKEK